MKAHDLVTLFKTFNDHYIQYVVVGGLAVNFHGYQRFTRDVDLLVNLEKQEILKLIPVLKNLGFSPIVPVSLDDYGDKVKRQIWSEERSMTVFSVVSDQLQGLTLDLFVKNPFDFQSLKEDLIYEEILDGVLVPVIDVGRLISMKEEVAREQDLIDVQNLKKLQDEYL